MPTPKNRPATIFFFKRYELGETEGLIRGGDMDSIDDDISYWLGKSPGIYMDEYDKIAVVEDCNMIDKTDAIQLKRDRQAQYEARLSESKEREQYERLKQKYGQQM